jgi:hypothetical protein
VCVWTFSTARYNALPHAIANTFDAAAAAAVASLLLFLLSDLHGCIDKSDHYMCEEGKKTRNVSVLLQLLTNTNSNSDAIATATTSTTLSSLHLHLCRKR